jgi:hypothetical protein
MDWLGWLLIILALGGVFAAWDLIFCGGERCRSLVDRLPLRSGDVGSSEMGRRDPAAGGDAKPPPSPEQVTPPDQRPPSP